MLDQKLSSTMLSRSSPSETVFPITSTARSGAVCPTGSVLAERPSMHADSVKATIREQTYLAQARPKCLLTIVDVIRLYHR